MAVPFRRTSKARRDKRKASFYLKLNSVSVCKNCNLPVINHRMCQECNYYNGQKIGKEITKKNKTKEVKPETQQLDSNSEAVEISSDEKQAIPNPSQDQNPE
jgi:large subunit ribosomal protein L32